VVFEPRDAVDPLLVGAFADFLLSVDAVVADAGFADSQGVSAVFVQGFGARAFLFGDELLDFV
jgi:hypothetical protein